MRRPDREGVSMTETVDTGTSETVFGDKIVDSRVVERQIGRII